MREFTEKGDWIQLEEREFCSVFTGCETIVKQFFTL